MDVERSQDGQDDAVSRIAAAIGEPARARMLFCLMGNRARTSTELALIADVSPSTASGHLNRLRDARLIRVLVQGKHRYYSLDGAEVADVLEGLSVLAGGARRDVVSRTPERLRAARTCYDHIAGALGVALHDRLTALGWLHADAAGDGRTYDVTSDGGRGLAALGIDVEACRTRRRRLAHACLDWSERRSHLGGAVGAALLARALEQRWVAGEPEGRALRLTDLGRRALSAPLGLAM